MVLSSIFAQTVARLNSIKVLQGTLGVARSRVHVAESARSNASSMDLGSSCSPIFMGAPVIVGALSRSLLRDRTVFCPPCTLPAIWYNEPG